MKSLAKIPKVPKEWQITNDWDSHKPALWFALKNTSEDVVELGSGFGSTPLLKKYCDDNNREFITYETNKEWAESTGSIFVKDYFRTLGKLDVVFVDAAPGEIRKDLINHYRDANVIVVHDSEPSANYVYGMKDILGTFKYRIDFQPHSYPHTTIVSDKINIEEWI